VRILVVANDGDADTGHVGARLRARVPDAEFTTLVRERHDEWPPIAPPASRSARPTEMLLILGSSWSVHWPRLAREVEAECALIRTAQAADMPILAICYGAQIAARALGGDAMPADRPEIGWCGVDAAPGTDAPVAGEWFQWHVDTFAPPPGAAVLASSPSGPQAYRLGRTLATQFHPEVTLDVVERWAADASDALPTRLGARPADLVAATRERDRGNAAAAARLVDWFLDEVATAAR